MGRHGAARPALYCSLCGALLCRDPASASLLLSAPPITAITGVRLEVNLKLTLSRMQELIDRKITQLPPPLMVMRSCLSGGLRGQRLPVWDSPGRYCHLAVDALKLRLPPKPPTPPPKPKVRTVQSQLTGIIIPSARCLLVSAATRRQRWTF